MSALGAMHVQSERPGYMSGGAGGAGPRSKMTPERECVSESTETPHPPEHAPLISSKAHILNKEDWNHVAELPIDGLDQLAVPDQAAEFLLAMDLTVLLQVRSRNSRAAPTPWASAACSIRLAALAVTHRLLLVSSLHSYTYNVVHPTAQILCFCDASGRHAASLSPVVGANVSCKLFGAPVLENTALHVFYTSVSGRGGRTSCSTRNAVQTHPSSELRVPRRASTSSTVKVLPLTPVHLPRPWRSPRTKCPSY